jgi:hypothetical protein
MERPGVTNKVILVRSENAVQSSSEIQFAGPASQARLAEDSSTNEVRYAFANSGPTVANSDLAH